MISPIIILLELTAPCTLADSNASTIKLSFGDIVGIELNCQEAFTGFYANVKYCIYVYIYKKNK